MASLIWAKAIFFRLRMSEDFKKTLLSGYLGRAELLPKKSKRPFICSKKGVQFAEKSGALRAPGAKIIMNMWETICFISILVLPGVPDGNREAILSGLHVLCDFSRIFKKALYLGYDAILSGPYFAERGHLSGPREAIYLFRYCTTTYTVGISVGI